MTVHDAANHSGTCPGPVEGDTMTQQVADMTCVPCLLHIISALLPLAGNAIPEEQYRVTWFPADVNQRSKQVADAAAATALADEHEQEAPMIERRVLTDWTIIENYAQRARS
jgi:hypothetical protein